MSSDTSAVDASSPVVGDATVCRLLLLLLLLLLLRSQAACDSNGVTATAGAAMSLSDPASAPPPTLFPFPFTPYTVQQQLMQCIFDICRTGAHHVAMIESPTGTGKSLSIICATLHWLLDYYPTHTQTACSCHCHTTATTECKENDTSNNICSCSCATLSSEPEWVRSFAASEQSKAITVASEQLAERKKRVSSMKQHMRVNYKKKEKQQEQTAATNQSLLHDDADLLLSWSDHSSKSAPSSGLPEWQRLMQVEKELKREQMSAAAAVQSILDDVTEQYTQDSWLQQVKHGEQSNVSSVPQIVYCSRTHSQLAQFLGEIRKTSFADRVSVITLGSRKQLCIHPSLASLDSVRMNDLCLEMQKSKNSKKEQAVGEHVQKRTRKSLTETSCPYLQRDGIQLFR